MKKLECQKCGQQTFLPFKCPYCDDYFCSEHRLPENHDCPRIELVRRPKRGEQSMLAQRRNIHPHLTFELFGSKRKQIRFSIKEIKHLTLAMLLVIAIGLSMEITPRVYSPMGGISMIIIFTTILAASFFIHELAHKISAQRRGLWAEFRLTFTGAIITLVSIISPLFKIISPGAVMVAGPTKREDLGKISIAGPVTNIILSAIFLLVAFLQTRYFSVFLFGSAFNTWIAFFNLIPFGMLDGFKIFLWNKKVWAIAFSVSLVLTLISYYYIL